MPTATLTSKGQVTIPSEVRKELRLFSGSKIDFLKNEKGDYVLRPKRGSIMEMAGILRHRGAFPPESPVTIEEMDQAIAQHAIELDKATLSPKARKPRHGTR